MLGTSLNKPQRSKVRYRIGSLKTEDSLSVKLTCWELQVGRYIAHAERQYEHVSDCCQICALHPPTLLCLCMNFWPYIKWVFPFQKLKTAWKRTRLHYLIISHARWRNIPSCKQCTSQEMDIPPLGLLIKVLRKLLWMGQHWLEGKSCCCSHTEKWIQSRNCDHTIQSW